MCTTNLRLIWENCKIILKLFKNCAPSFLCWQRTIGLLLGDSTVAHVNTLPRWLHSISPASQTSYLIHCASDTVTQISTVLIISITLAVHKSFDGTENPDIRSFKIIFKGLAEHAICIAKFGYCHDMSSLSSVCCLSSVLWQKSEAGIVQFSLKSGEI